MLKSKTCNTLHFYACPFTSFNSVLLLFTFHLKACPQTFSRASLCRASLVTSLEALHSSVSRSTPSFRPCSSRVTWRERCSSLRIFMPKSRSTGAPAKPWRRAVRVWREKRWGSVHGGIYFMLCILQRRGGWACCLGWFPLPREVAVDKPVLFIDCRLAA